MNEWLKPLSVLEFRGQRIFAGQCFKKGKMLERSPVIPVPANEWTLVSQTVLRYYCYAWGDNHQDTALALGWGSFFKNPSGEAPNTYYVNCNESMVMEFFAARDLIQGEEITISRRKPLLARQTAEISPCRKQENMMICIQNSPGKGRGVFARRPIGGNELIERAAALIIPAGEWAGIEKTVLSNYWFSFGFNREHAIIPMGYGALYNHSYTPNAVYEVIDADLVVQFKALRDIPAGEEITVNYNRDPRDRSPVWFDVLP